MRPQGRWFSSIAGWCGFHQHCSGVPFVFVRTLFQQCCCGAHQREYMYVLHVIVAWRFPSCVDGRLRLRYGLLADAISHQSSTSERNQHFRRHFVIRHALLRNSAPSLFLVYCMPSRRVTHLAQVLAYFCLLKAWRRHISFGCTKVHSWPQTDFTDILRLPFAW